MRFVCATHGHCFDGLASSVVFRRLLHEVHPGARVEVLSCGYGSRQLRPSSELLNGEGNAILDFRYFPIDSLTFYYDHHRTAFQEPDDERHFLTKAAQSPDRFQLDLTAVSCTRLIAKTAERSFGANLSDLDSLLEWADKIDSASFGSAKEATDRQDPIMRLVTVVEQFGDSAFLQRASDLLLRDGLEALAKSDFVEQRFKSIEKRQLDYVRLVRDKGLQEGRVAYIDLLDASVQSVTKFAQYSEFPTATYSIVLASMASGIRLSIGYNPWGPEKLMHDISQICARYGGGGHPVVGGIALSKGDSQEARRIAREILEELNR